MSRPLKAWAETLLRAAVFGAILKATGASATMRGVTPAKGKPQDVAGIAPGTVRRRKRPDHWGTPEPVPVDPVDQEIEPEAWQRRRAAVWRRWAKLVAKDPDHRYSPSPRRDRERTWPPAGAALDGITGEALTVRFAHLADAKGEHVKLAPRGDRRGRSV